MKNPNYVSFTLKEKEFLEIGKVMVKNKSDLDFEPTLYVDEENGDVYMDFEKDIDDLNDEDYDLLVDERLHPDSFFDMTEAILCEIFQTTDVYATVYLDAYRAQVKSKMDILINLDVNYDDWLKVKDNEDFLFNIMFKEN